MEPIVVLHDRKVLDTNKATQLNAKKINALLSRDTFYIQYVLFKF